MLSLRTSPLFFSHLSHAFSATKHLKLTRHSQTNFTLKMSTTATNTTTSKNQTIEHIVLFKVKPDTDSSKINSMLNGLNGLISLDPVLHLSAGALLRTRSSTLNFTHMLHSRYSSKDNLSAYSSHPDHVRVVKEYVLPICEDVMAVDWVADDLDGEVSPKPGSAVRVMFLKVKENVGDRVKSEILGVVEGLKKFGGIVQLTCGENFSPARAKGFGIVSLAVFNGVSEMESVVGNEELVGLEKDKVREYLESVLVVDYVVPAVVPAQHAGL